MPTTQSLCVVMRNNVSSDHPSSWDCVHIAICLDLSLCLSSVCPLSTGVVLDSLLSTKTRTWRRETSREDFGNFFFFFLGGGLRGRKAGGDRGQNTLDQDVAISPYPEVAGVRPVSSH